MIQMHKTYIVSGRVTDSHTVTLDEELPLGPIKVRLVVEPLDAGPQQLYSQVVEKIRERQRERGHQPPTREAVDAWLQAEKDSWW